jgi:SAM-dependent methyltransferase
MKRFVFHFEHAIEDAVRAFAAELAGSARILDAGAGEGRYARWFTRQRYVGVDLAVGDPAWNYARLDAICDLDALPFADTSFDAALSIVTLEHLPEPGAALREMARVLRPGAPLLIVVPFEWEVHQAPHDYFRFTRYGLEYLLRRAGFEAIDIRPVGGYGRLLSRRLLNGVRLVPPTAILLAPLALIAPLLDRIDPKSAFTLGYICRATARKD